MHNFAAVDQTTSSVLVEGYVDPLLLRGLEPEKAAPWLVQRMILRPRTSAGFGAGRDVFPLAAGQHTIVLSIAAARNDGVSDEFGDVVVTNDLTWTPDDYDARRLFDLRCAGPNDFPAHRPWAVTPISCEGYANIQGVAREVIPCNSLTER